ncbi:MAG: cytochrome d ubiquinol oxidase subunit II [Sulfurovum sp.]|nr:cytochrome d ubiquinol oxidase subunit II [Sulfurovum sp.]
MFESLSLLTLQQYWWFIVTLLGAFFCLFDVCSRWTDIAQYFSQIGGALFAAFPLLYAVSFAGAYYVWMAILFCFIIQAVSYEYRKKPNNFFLDKKLTKPFYISMVR